MIKEKSVTEQRERYIGGSDCPAIMGISPFKSRWELLLEKAGFEQHDGSLSTPEIEYGNEMEAPIRDYINKFMRTNFKPDVVIKDDMRGNMDGYDGDTVLEIKTTSVIHSSAREYKYYVVQLLFYMKLVGAVQGYLAVYERPMDFNTKLNPEALQVFSIKYEEYEDWVDEIGFQLDRFRNDLERIKENPLLTEEDLQPKEIVEMANMCLALEEQVAFYKDIEAEYKKYKEQLKNAMQERGIKRWITTGGTKITLVPDGEDKTVWELDEKSLKENLPEIFKPEHDGGYMVEKVKKGRSGYVRITPPKEE